MQLSKQLGKAWNFDVKAILPKAKAVKIWPEGAWPQELHHCITTNMHVYCSHIVNSTHAHTSGSAVCTQALSTTVHWNLQLVLKAEEMWYTHLVWPCIEMKAFTI